MRLTIFRTCCEKLWLMKVASNARFLGLLIPSSAGGSFDVSETVNKSESTAQNNQEH